MAARKRNAGRERTGRAREYGRGVWREVHDADVLISRSTRRLQQRAFLLAEGAFEFEVAQHSLLVNTSFQDTLGDIERDILTGDDVHDELGDHFSVDVLECAVRLLATGGNVPVAELAAVPDALSHFFPQGCADPADVRVDAETFGCRRGDASGQEAHGCGDGAYAIGLGEAQGDA